LCQFSAIQLKKNKLINNLHNAIVLEQFGDLGLDPLEVGTDPGVGHGEGAGAALVDAVDAEQTDGQLGHKREHHWTAGVELEKWKILKKVKGKKRDTDQAKAASAGGGAEAGSGVRVRDVSGRRLGCARRLAQLHQVHIIQCRSKRSRYTKLKLKSPYSREMAPNIRVGALYWYRGFLVDNFFKFQKS